MDARAAESDLAPVMGWFARERESGRFYRFAKLGSALLILAVLLGTIALIPNSAEPGTLISPPLMALLLIANLLPAILLMVLVARDAARRNATGRGVGTGQLHTRLVALFSIVAAVPTVVVAIFASLLLQSGLEFWFSNRARTMLENTVSLAQGAYANEVRRLGSEAVTMSGDLGGYLKQLPIDSPKFATGVSYQTYVRSLNESAVLNVMPSGEVQTLAAVNIYEGMIDQKRISQAVAHLATGQVAEVATPNRVAVLTKLDFGKMTYLYVAKNLDPGVRAQINGAGRVLTDYRTLLNRSRVNQLRFNVALY
ncbi:MAG: PAS domain-containing sensor histidine kinase, partial [Pseudomonadota bacterium]|nr:PAS domain-containing sensor histidine kinase [Pseudomonadota bacterium]